jgi:hypothetical protein
LNALRTRKKEGKGEAMRSFGISREYLILYLEVADVDGFAVCVKDVFALGVGVQVDSLTTGSQRRAGKNGCYDKGRYQLFVVIDVSTGQCSDFVPERL